MEAMQPMQLICSIFGYFYIRKSRIYIPNKLSMLLDLLEGLRCFGFITLFLYFTLQEWEDHYWRISSDAISLEPKLLSFITLFKYCTVNINIYKFYHTNVI